MISMILNYWQVVKKNIRHINVLQLSNVATVYFSTCTEIVSTVTLYALAIKR